LREEKQGAVRLHWKGRKNLVRIQIREIRVCNWGIVVEGQKQIREKGKLGVGD